MAAHRHHLDPAPVGVHPLQPVDQRRQLTGPGRRGGGVDDVVGGLDDLPHRDRRERQHQRGPPLSDPRRRSARAGRMRRSLGAASTTTPPKIMPSRETLVPTWEGISQVSTTRASTAPRRPAPCATRPGTAATRRARP